MMAVPDISLRKVEPDDLPFLFKWENDSSAWLDGDTHNPLSQEDLRAYLLNTTGDIYRDGQLRMIICRTSAEQNSVPSAEQNPVTPLPDEPLGCIDLYDVDIRNRKAAVALYIAPAFRHRGLAQTALKQMLAYLAHILSFRLAYAFTRIDNAASCRTFECAGFQRVTSIPRWTLESDAVLWVYTL